MKLEDQSRAHYLSNQVKNEKNTTSNEIHQPAATFLSFPCQDITRRDVSKMEAPLINNAFTAWTMVEVLPVPGIPRISYQEQWRTDKYLPVHSSYVSSTFLSSQPGDSKT
ncbi:hypothetical protein Ccrd_000804 [Cynara cardunculus var. scolymus]|uniref:Uncharacterized protein n=1 Tax=Cynara cardunculus var. scolymus TaxID=59895 RepID=A0A103XUH2_CYNCS|nr:hypothetical protein Ccrd_000804 [Cynara cardunculus var. scolymus]